MSKRVLAAAAATMLIAGAMLATSCGSEEETTLTAMSFNIWGGGGSEDKPVDATVTAIEEAAATFVFGDFNEPSAHDWTEPAVSAGNQPLEVAWPTTASLEELGFVDAYREIHPDPAEKPAFTWTPTSKPTVKWDHHDRIDFVLARGDDLSVVDAAIVGEKRPDADLVVKPWPSDHRAATATVEF